MDQIKVPVQNEKGETVMEPLNLGGYQSDGSMWTKPIPLIDPSHEHYFVMKPEDRVALCACGFGGKVFPHNADLIDGHVYNKKKEKVI